MPSPSSLRWNAERSFHGDLAAWVAERRADDWSWRAISKELLLNHGIDLSYESLRAWYGEADRTSA